ncbi:extracellular solute-binding protein [Zoogloea sp.]|uniref:extracellular solute-binding protein n=1 Tax=Zoogloea sp. TaxID=49181 RepID=UPI0035B2A50E
MPTASRPRPERAGRHAARLGLLLIALVVGATAARADDSRTVRLAAVEREPYAAANLPDQGYVPELVTAAFARSGYRVHITFYPPDRARRMALDGEVDGWMPVHADSAMRDAFALSAPFPGDHVGLLKRKETPIRLRADAARQPAAALLELGGHRFGLTRGSLSGAAADAVAPLQKELVARDLQNLDKLANRRIDLVVIDKYMAADLMALQRPQYIGKLEFLSPALFPAPFHVAFASSRPDQAGLRKAFDAGLAALEKDGSLARILARHGLATPAAPRGNGVRLTIGTVNNREMQVMQRLSKRFEQSHPGITLEWRVLEENILRRRTLSDLAIGDGQFDVVTIGPNEAQTWHRGWLAPIGPLPGGYDLADVLPSVRELLTVDGTLYALPFYAESSMTYYRTDLFREAGLVMPAQPTVQDIQRFAHALHRPERRQYGICLRGRPGWGENLAIVGTLVNTFGGRWLRPDWTPEIDSPEWSRAIGWYLDVLRSFGPPKPEQNGFNESLRLFADGHCAIWIDATVAAGSLYNRRESKVATHLGYAAAPIAETPKGAHWLWTWALAIPASTPRQQAAQAFVAWATSKDYIRLVAATEGWVAAPPGTRRSTYANPDYKTAAPFADFVLDALVSADPRAPTAKPVPYTGIQVLSIPEFPAIGNQVGQEIALALKGGQSAAQALRRAQQATYKQMRDSGYYPESP